MIELNTGDGDVSLINLFYILNNIFKYKERINKCCVTIV